MTAPDHRHRDDGSCCTNLAWLEGAVWWATLAIAVLAIPTLAFGVALAIPSEHEMAQAAVFIITCWVSTWLGMRLMNRAHKRKNAHKKDG